MQYHRCILGLSNNEVCIMKNRDIKILKCCFSVAGQKSRQETDCWLQEVKLCLQHAGA